MKKTICALLALFTISSFSFAQETENSSDFSRFRLGVNASYMPALGDMADFVYGSIGAGLSVETDFNLNSKIIEAAGVSADITFGISPVKSQLLLSMKNADLLAGGYIRIPLFAEGIYFQPGINLGISVSMPEANPEHQNQLGSFYLDPKIQASFGLRISSPSMVNGKMELDITPTAEIVPEQGDFFYSAGCRVGVFFRF